MSLVAEACVPEISQTTLPEMRVQALRARDAMESEPLVLIVEDDQSTRLMYREFLNHSGFRTADAHNGFQALEKARELRPDLVVTDIAVPGMDGFEFCRALASVHRDA